MARQTGIVLAPPLIIIGDECFVRIAHSDADHDALSINHAAEAALPNRQNNGVGYGADISADPLRAYPLAGHCKAIIRRKAER